MAISDEMTTFSQIEGQAMPEGRVRRWHIRVAEWIFDDRGAAKSSEIGSVHVFTVPELDLECLADCDSTSGDLETVMTALVESEEAELWPPVLIIDSIYVKPKYRGRGLATMVAEEAVRWFDGLVNLAALAVTDKPKYRPVAARVVEKLRFRQLKDDIWIRGLS